MLVSDVALKHLCIGDVLEYPNAGSPLVATPDAVCIFVFAVRIVAGQHAMQCSMETPAAKGHLAARSVCTALNTFALAHCFSTSNIAAISGTEILCFANFAVYVFLHLLGF